MSDNESEEEWSSESSCDEGDVDYDEPAPEIQLVAEEPEPLVEKEPILDTEVSSQRTTQPILSKYESARLLGLRTEQLHHGAKATVDVGQETDAMTIAKKELDTLSLPITIRRHVSKTRYEDWQLNEFPTFNKKIKFTEL